MIAGTLAAVAIAAANPARAGELAQVTLEHIQLAQLFVDHGPVIKQFRCRWQLLYSPRLRLS